MFFVMVNEMDIFEVASHERENCHQFLRTRKSLRTVVEELRDLHAIFGCYDLADFLTPFQFINQHFTNAVGGRDGQIKVFLDVIEADHPRAFACATEPAFDHPICYASDLIFKNLPGFRQVGGISRICRSFRADENSVIIAFTQNEKAMLSFTVIVGFVCVIGDEIIVIQHLTVETGILFTTQFRNADDICFAYIGGVFFAFKSCFEIHVYPPYRLLNCCFSSSEKETPKAEEIRSHRLCSSLCKRKQSAYR